MTSITQNRSRPCPVKLEKLLTQLNMIPAKENLRALEIGSYELFMNDRLHLEALQDLALKLEPYTGEFKEFVYGRKVRCVVPHGMYFLPDLDVREARDALSRYESIQRNRYLIRGLIKNLENCWDLDGTLNLTGRKRVGTQLPYLFKHEARAAIDEEGRIKFAADEFVEALDGVEASRIGQCEVCKKLFWKGRRDKKACDNRCANTLRVRNSREAKSRNRILYDHAEVKKQFERKSKS